MSYTKIYNYPSEYTENDDIYDEETDYYTEDSDLSMSKKAPNNLLLKNFYEYNET